MNEFLNKLYSYENFGLYLIIAIVVLVILFFVILFMGKKDKKEREISATKKLQQINGENAFKEESQVNSVEVTPSNEVQPDLNDTIVVPQIDDVPVMNNEPVVTEEAPTFEPIPNVEPVIQNSVNNFDNISNQVNDFVPPVVTTEQTTSMPILDKIEEKPLVFNEPEIKPIEDNNINLEDTLEIPNDMNSESKLVDVPTFNINELLNDIKPLEETEKPVVESTPSFNNIAPAFSFDQIMNDKKEEIETPIIEEKQPEPIIPSFDFGSVFPREELKEEPKEEKPVINEPVFNNQEVFSSVYAPKKEEKAEDDLGIELPALKKENIEPEKKDESPVIDIPILNNYNLDEISGESYTIDKE